MNNNKKSLWIFNHYAIPPEMPGGTRHFDFAKEFIKKGYQVNIFASGLRYVKRIDGELKKDESSREEWIDGVRFIWLKTFPYERNDWRRILGMFIYMWRAMWMGIKLKEKPDIIVGSSVHLLAVFAAYILAQIKKAKFIFEVRDLWPQTLIDLGNYKKHNLFIIFMRQLEKFLYIKAKKIITLAPKANEYITKLGITSEKIVWIPNGVDLNMFRNRTKRKSTNNHFLISYIGAHGKANVLEVILEAAKIIQDKAINNIKIEFVGDGPEKLNLINKAHKMKLKIVEFKESVPKEKIPEIMEEPKAFILCLEDAPLYKYGISLNKIYDYLASGKPIIFSGNSINNPIEKARAGLTVPPRNPQALAKGIINLYNLSAEEKKEMGKRGRKYVEKYHSIEMLADKFLKIIS